MSTQPENIVLACRLQGAEAKMLISIFEVFWADSQIKAAVARIAAQVHSSSAHGSAARTPPHSDTAANQERSRANAEHKAAEGQNRKAAAKGLAVEVAGKPVSASPRQVPADGSSHADQLPSKKEAAKHDRCDSCKAAEAREPSQQGSDKAADVAADATKGAGSKGPPHQGRHTCNQRLQYFHSACFT